MNHVKIALFISSFNFGGAERQFVTLANGLSKIGYKVTVISLYKEGYFVNNLDDENIDIIYLNRTSRWKVIVCWLKFIYLIRILKPQILHSYLPVPNLFTIPIKILYPKIKIILGFRASELDLPNYKFLTRHTYILQYKLSGFADFAIINSMAGQKYAISNGVSENKTRVISNGIDTDYFIFDEKGRNYFRENLGIPPDTYLIGIVARPDPMKGHETFLEAASLLTDARDDVYFVCVGNNETDYYNHTIKPNCIEKLTNRLYWIGEQADLPGIYSAMDIMTSPSYFGEGFSNVIAEAMSCGLHCVVTDVGDSTIIIGDDGIVIPTRDPAALASAWLKTINELNTDNERINCVRRDRIVDCFSVNKLIADTDSTFKELIKAA